jgi:putative acetyltransferase
MSETGLSIAEVTRAEDCAPVRELFLEYAAQLGFSLCFQGFDKEVAGLPGDYVRPGGRLLLAHYNGELAGCVALHASHEAAIAEMKRLYVRPQFRGKKIGRALLDRVLDEARSAGYCAVRLDTIAERMREAVAMYRAYGFKEIAAYRPNPEPSVLYMELELDSRFDTAGSSAAPLSGSARNDNRT